MTECFVHSAVVGLILENAQPGNKAGNKKGQSGHLFAIGNNAQIVTGFKILNKVWTWLIAVVIYRMAPTIRLAFACWTLTQLCGGEWNKLCLIFSRFNMQCLLMENAKKGGNVGRGRIALNFKQNKNYWSPWSLTLLNGSNWSQNWGVWFATRKRREFVARKIKRPMEVICKQLDNLTSLFFQVVVMSDGVVSKEKIVQNS